MTDQSKAILSSDVALRALGQCTDTIVESTIDPKALARKLYSKEVISESVYKKVRDKEARDSKEERIEEVLDDLRDRIKHDPNVLTKFLIALKELERNDLAVIIETKYQELAGNSLSINIQGKQSTNQICEPRQTMLDVSTCNKVADPLVKEPVNVSETSVANTITVISESPAKSVPYSDQSIADTAKTVALKFPEERVHDYQWELAQPEKEYGEKENKEEMLCHTEELSPFDSLITTEREFLSLATNRKHMLSDPIESETKKPAYDANILNTTRKRKNDSEGEDENPSKRSMIDEVISYQANNSTTLEQPNPFVLSLRDQEIIPGIQQEESKLDINSFSTSQPCLPEDNHGIPSSFAPIVSKQDVGEVSATNDMISDKVVSLKFPKENVRHYQWELAQPGLNGENYIICAPTGSGKTLISTLIIENHIKRKAVTGNDANVLFVVKTQQLARQQRDKIEEYLQGASVLVVAGESNASISSCLSEHDIVVCTSGKLQAQLQGEKIKISTATLLVIDECHHTAGNDPYAEIMEYYLLEKKEFGTSPQVIGMTASLGTGRHKNPTLDKVVSHHKKLCARLDATSGIKTVKNNLDELRQHVSLPSHNSHSLPQRDPNEPYIRVISDTMLELEKMLPQEVVVKHDRNSLAYQQWIKIEIEAAQLNGAENQRDQITILEHLEVYALARMTYEDFEAKYATNVLQRLHSDDESIMNETEKKLQTVLSKTLHQLSNIPETANPLLVKAEEILYKHFSSKPDSRGLFFVRDIEHTHYIVEWLKKSAKLRYLIKPASICGHSKHGMSKEEQVRIIEGFKNGKFNVLSTTSVLEEGLDVPECNMVIRFQIMSNEIAEVQAQGRARANDSKMHTIITSNSSMHYNQLLNKERKELADAAIDYVSIYTLELHKMQEDIICLREQRLKAQAERKNIWDTKDVELLCRKCGVVACKASEVCKYDITSSAPQYIVPNQSFMLKMKKMPRKRPEPITTAEITRPLKIGCVNCSDEWGVWGCWKYSDAQYPILKCKSFTFHNVKLRQKENSKQWKLVPFNVLFYTEFIEQEDEV